MKILTRTFGLMTLLCISTPSQSDILANFYGSVGYLYSSTEGTAKTDRVVSTGFPPRSFSLNGLPFKDDDSGWSAALGYQFVNFFAVEIGYEHLGQFGSSADFLQQDTDRPVLDVGGVSLKAQFQYPLTDRLRATWHIGVVRADFDAEGSVQFLTTLPPFPLYSFPDTVAVPYADPGRETGYFFGFGASWRLNNHLDVELSYSRKDLEVLEFDSFGVRLIGRL